MSAQDIITKLPGVTIEWGIIILFILLSLVQISPIKLNPWDSILGWLGDKLNGKELEDLHGKIGEMRSELNELHKKINAMWVNSHRQHILTFARELRAGISHSTDEWSNVLSIIDEYETYCEKNHIANGVVKADARFINELYQKLSHEQKL